MTTYWIHCQWHSQKILIGEADPDFGIYSFAACGGFFIRVTALLGYLNLAIQVLEMPELLLMYGVALLL